MSYFSSSREFDSSSKGSSSLTTFLYPTEVRFQPIAVISSTDVYLNAVLNNIRAEYWKFLESVPTNLRFPITTSTGHEDGKTVNFINTIESKEIDEKGKEVSKQMDLETFSNHLVVWKRSYAILKEDTQVPGRLKILTGDSFRKSLELDGFTGAIDSILFDLGYIGDVINEYTSCQNLLRMRESDRPSILASIANPMLRKAVSYRTARSGLTSSSKHRVVRREVPINSQQLKVINGLNFEIEGIQGPPGTGKSTVIYHIVCSCLPVEGVTLATCVQNKAVDSIADKFGQDGVALIPFFVFGNEERLGLTSKFWTLESQVSRDKRVVALARRLKLLTGILSTIETAIYFHNNRRFQSKTRALSRYLRAEKLFPTKSGSENQRGKNLEKQQIWLVNDPWRRWWERRVQQKFPMLFRFKNYLQRETSSLRIKLEEMETLVEEELIKNTKVILCTIATASGSLLKEFRIQVAVSAIATVILDEAGTVPESKMPLLASLNPSRIISIGDQNQLSPFTRIQPPHHHHHSSGSSRGNDNVCHRFSATGYCRFGKACRFTHSRSSAGRRVSMSSRAASAGDTGSDELPQSFFQRLEKALKLKSNDTDALTSSFQKLMLSPSASSPKSKTPSPVNSASGAVARGIPCLTDQYRMHPSISDFISKQFYNSHLKTPALVAEARKAVDPTGLWWLNYTGTGIDAENTPMRSKSKQNLHEVALILDLFSKKNVPANKSAMIITFYKAQESALKKAFLDAKIEEHEGFRILTVDQSQGSEADVVVLSCVRSNARASIGFLSNPNRMNVAISRAKERLVVVADGSTVQSDSKWKNLKKCCKVIRNSGELTKLN